MLESYTQQVMERCFTLYNREGIWTKTTMTWCYTLRMSNTSENVEQNESLSFGEYMMSYTKWENLRGPYKTKHGFTMWSSNHFFALFPHNLAYIHMFLHGHLINNFATWKELRSFLLGELKEAVLFNICTVSQSILKKKLKSVGIHQS